MKVYKLYSSTSRSNHNKDIYIGDKNRALELFYDDIHNCIKCVKSLRDTPFNDSVNELKDDIMHFAELQNESFEVIEIKNPYIIYKRDTIYKAVVFYLYHDEFNDFYYEP